jgi:mannose-6-phosphate isomerase-like protein (cupin superfamily)
VGEANARLLGPGEGPSFGTAGTSVVLKAGADDTNGGWTLFEYTAPPNFAGPPPHWHKSFDEGFYVLEGTVRFELDGKSVDVGAGAFAHVPPGVVHRFSNPTDQPARMLGLTVPGGFEKYFEEVGEMMAGSTSWPPADMTPLVELMAKYDTFPPPGPQDR